VNILKKVCFENGRAIIKEVQKRKTLKQFHKIFADSSKGHKTRMAALNAETRLESDIVRKIYTFMKAADPNPDNVENILRAVKVLFDRQTISDEYGI